MDKIREIQKEMMQTMIEELKKCIPEDVQNDLKEVAEIHAKTELRMRMAQKISVREIERYNELVGKHFARIQNDEVDEVRTEGPGITVEEEESEGCGCCGCCAKAQLGNWIVWLDCEGSLHVEKIEEDDEE